MLAPAGSRSTYLRKTTHCDTYSKRMKTPYLISRLIDGAEYYREGNVTRSKIQTAYEELITDHDKEIMKIIDEMILDFFHAKVEPNADPINVTEYNRTGDSGDIDYEDIERLRTDLKSKIRN